MAVRMAATAVAIQSYNIEGATIEALLRQVREQPGSQGAMHCSREPSYHSAEHPTPNIATLSPMMHIRSSKCEPCTHTSPQGLRLIPSTLAASPVLFSQKYG